MSRGRDEHCENVLSSPDPVCSTTATPSVDFEEDSLRPYIAAAIEDIRDVDRNFLGSPKEFTQDDKDFLATLNWAALASCTF